MAATSEAEAQGPGVRHRRLAPDVPVDQDAAAAAAGMSFGEEAKVAKAGVHLT
jgi:hypothetical protein